MNKLLILGGVDRNLCISNKVLILDGCQWKDYREIPTTRGNIGVASYKTMMIVLGGGNRSQFFGTTEVFDDTTGQWFNCNDLPHPFDLLQPVILGDTLYVLNGNPNNVYVAPLDNLSSHYQLDWQRLADIPRIDSAAAVLDNKYLLVVGGDAISNTVCVLKTTKSAMITSSSWESIGCLPVVLTVPSTICYGNQLIVIGGLEKDEDKISNAVHIGTFQ